MKIVIIEDERPASQKLIRLLGGLDPAIEVSVVLESVEQAVEWFRNHPAPELVFMDIQLEDSLCFEIFEHYNLQTPVIFTTAYDEYALKAFKVNSVDYLLKPIIPGELKDALEKFSRLHDPFKTPPPLENLIGQWYPQTKERFLVKIGDRYKSIAVSDILCFYMLERNLFMRVNTGRNYSLDYSLDQIERWVDPKLFFRINRNFIIRWHAIEEIIAYSSHRLKVLLAHWKEKEELIVSRGRVAAFKEWMDR